MTPAPRCRLCNRKLGRASRNPVCHACRGIHDARPLHPPLDRYERGARERLDAGVRVFTEAERRAYERELQERDAASFRRTLPDGVPHAPYGMRKRGAR
jgi:hypothetical protein